jgi:hypothetical protein
MQLLHASSAWGLAVPVLLLVMEQYNFLASAQLFASNPCVEWCIFGEQRLGSTMCIYRR